MYKSCSPQRNRRTNSPLPNRKDFRYSSPVPSARRGELNTPQTPKEAANAFGFKIRRVRELLASFISLSSKSQGRQTGLSEKQVEEMMLRLNGAFERLASFQRSHADPFTHQAELKSQLSAVIEGCLCDLELKLKTLTHSESASEPELREVRALIGRITN